jgi:ATP-dependent helicase HepA
MIVVGQRYKSLAEPDLGVGEVVGLDKMNFAIQFPRTGEQRIYRQKGAPVERYAYEVGDVLNLEGGKVLTVAKIENVDGLNNYIGKAKSILESELPFTDEKSGENLLSSIFESPVEDIESWELRSRALELKSRIESSPMRGLVGARIDAIPHQLYIAATATAEPRIPRRLLSDEVGLGKTIEAGLIFHRLKLTGQIKRVLVLTPESLSHQWMVEMYRRFNTLFAMINDDYVESIEEADPDANPFELKNEVICDLDFVFCEGRRMRQVLETSWDLVIVDEAHRIDPGEAENSYEYEFLKKLTRKTPGLLLLTATPIQLQLRAHFSRLHLIDPVRFADFEKWEVEHTNYQGVANELKELADVLKDDPKAWKKTIGSLPKDSKVSKLLEEQPEIFELEPDRCLRHLTDTLGTGRSVIRNTRQAIGGFPGRDLHTYEINEDEIYRRLTDEFLTEDIDYSKVDLELNQSFCVDKDFIEEQQAKKLVSTLWPRDEKVKWLVEFLSNVIKGEKVLCLCSTREAVVGIQETLARLTNIEVAVFFEDMPIVSRDRAAAWFAQEDGAQILIASEIGSEGRNFQFAKHIIMYDLPLEPGLLEQRIGRLDRIGQKNTINIHVPYVEDTPQQRLLEWYNEGLNAFLQPLLGVEVVQEKYKDELMHFIFNPGAEPEKMKKDLLSRVQIDTAEVRSKVEEGRDRLMEINSFDRRAANELVQGMADWDDDFEVMALVLEILEHLHVNIKNGTVRGTWIVKPGEGMKVAEIPGLPEEGITVTGDREIALTREDVQFISIDHPLTQTILEIYLDSNEGQIQFSTGKGALKGIFFEAIFRWESPQNPKWQLAPYYTDKYFHVCVDKQGKSSARYIEEIENGDLNEGSGSILPKLEEMLIEDFSTIEKGLEKSAKKHGKKMAEETLAKSTTVINSEIQRLKVLQKVDPERVGKRLMVLKRFVSEIEDASKSYSVQLDSLRMVVMN